MYKIKPQFEFSSLNKILNYLIVGLKLFVNLPVYFSQTYPGLDPSYFYLLNVATSKGLKFGSDLFITYGPLGFLVSSQNFGNNIILNFIFWFLVYLLNGFALYKIIIVRNIHFIFSLSSLLLVLLLNTLFAEYYILYVIILMISLAWFNPDKLYYFIFACLLTVMLMFIKFSGAIGAISCIVLFVISMFIINKEAGLKIGLISLLMPILFSIAYLFYNPSFEALKDYIFSAIDISSGYNSAMSLIATLPYSIFIILSASLLFVAYIILSIYTIYKDKKNGLYLLIFVGTLFFGFKHNFVRYSTIYRVSFFIFFLALLSVIIINLNSNIQKISEKIKTKKGLKYLILTCFILVVLLLIRVNFIRNFYIDSFPNKINSIINVPNQINNPIIASYAKKLKNEFIDSIADRKVLIYPWELTIDAYNKLNTVFLPIPQSYTAYTAYLDNKNANILEKDSFAPNFIVFTWEQWKHYEGAIDNRFPLIECPATWLQIFNNYSVISSYNNNLLLKRKVKNSTIKFSKIYKKNYQKSNWVNIPDSKELIVMQADISYNIIGKIMKFLFQIPATYLEVVYENNSIAIKRILPEVLTNPTIISNLPTNLNSVKMLINGNLDIERVKKIRLVKDRISWFLYKKDIEITFYTLNQ